MYRLLLLTLICAFFCGCKASEDGVTSCSFFETHFGGSSTAYVTLGQKIAQRFIVRENAKLTSINIEMDLLTSTSVKFSIVKAASGASTPTGGTTLVQTTLVSSQVSNSGKVLFKFPKTAVTTDIEYYLVFEPVGGDIEMTDQTGFPFSIAGEVWRYNGAWSSLANWDLSFSVSGDCD